MVLLGLLGIVPMITEYHADLPLFTPTYRLEPKEHHLQQAWAGIAQAGATAAQPELILAHAQAALNRGPANGYAWLTLAWGHELAGDRHEATAALLASWDNAPQLRNLARPRVFLALDRWPALPVRYRRLLLEDVNLLRQTDAAEFLKLRQVYPKLDAMWRLMAPRVRARIANTTSRTFQSRSPG